MYAIIRTGGKQYRVQAGDTVMVEKLENELGSSFDITDVLFVDGVFGEPTVKNAKVSVVVTEQGKDAKVFVFKKNRRKGYRRSKGHRQLFTKLFVQAITSPNGQTSKADTKAAVVDPAKKAERQAAYAAKVAASGEKPKKKVVKKVAAPAKKKVAKKAAKKGGAKKKAAKKAAKK